MDQRTTADALGDLVAEILGVTPPADGPLLPPGAGSMALAGLWLEIEERWGIELPFAVLAPDATPADVAAAIEQAPPAAAGDPEPPPGHGEAPFPLLPLQQAYLSGAHDELTADAVGCHQYVEFDVEDLDVERLRAAWQRLVEHHGMLRAIVTADGRQRIAPRPPDWRLPVHPAREAVRVRARLSHQCFDEASTPRFSVEVTRLDDRRARVHLNLDAVIADGLGLGLLLQQWEALYRNPEHDLGRPAPTAADCVAALRRRSTGARRERDLAYWSDRLADLPPGPAFVRPVPSGRPPPERVPLEGRLDAAQWSALQERARALRVSPTALVLAAFTDALTHAGAGERFSLIVTTSQRLYLPRKAAAVVGPFTSSAVLVVDGSAAASEAINERLRDAVEHSTVSAVEALRARRSAEAPAVVFTSMLEVGDTGGGFAADIAYAVSRTAGVALDHQIWERDGELRFRWDAVPDRLEPGALAGAFARFGNRLNGLALEGSPTTDAPLNALQEAYFVARQRIPAEGCQIYRRFEVPALDLDRLSSAVLELVAAHDRLRTWIGADGVLRTSAAPPPGWSVPVLTEEPHHEVAADMLRRPFELGRWPHFDVRVSAGRRTMVHCAFDVAVFDAPSVHMLCRELLRAAMQAPGPRSLPAAATSGVAGAPELDARTAALHWERRAQALPSGPRLDPPTAERVRLEGRLAGWGRLVRQAADRGVTADALLLAAFVEAVGSELEIDELVVPVVRWSAAGRMSTATERTAMSWVVAQPAGTDVVDAARSYHATIAEDLAADALSGLGAVRRRLLRSGGQPHPFVYTSLIDLSAWPLPAGVSEGPWASATPGVALDCIGTVDGDELFFCWDACPDCFAPGALEAAFAAYGRIVATLTGGTATGPHRGTLDPSTYRTVVYAWNATRRPFPAELAAHEGFERHARARPDAVAIRTAGGVTTFGDLDAHAEAIARHLTRLGVAAGSRVGIRVRREPAMVAAVLGVLKAGAAYVPVDPALPAARVEAMLTRTGARLVLTTTDTPPSALPRDVSAIAVDADVGEDDEPAVSQAARPDDLAYVIFTSGSTGAPKGVAVTHRAVSNLLAWGTRTFGFGPHDIGLCVTALAFDLSVFDLFGVLGSGGSLYLADEAERQDPALLLEAIHREGVTFWNSAPTVLSGLAPLLSDPDPRLRLVFLSGDFAPLWLPDRLRAAFPGARVVSLGGATEATVWSNWFEVRAVDPCWRSIPYGRPIDNARYHVLTESLQPCAVGEQGELHIGGECLALGYWNEPALTAERFVPDPFAAQPGQRLYRTGDRASYEPDGTIVLHGRLDGQVKIRGCRVELAEVEHRLRAHPAIRDVVVTVRGDGEDDRRLVAYLVAEGEERPAARDLRAFAAEALPDYMVPNHVAFIDALPATPNGKVDRAALPWPLTADEAAGTAAPDTALEELTAEIAALFAAQLGVESMDPDADIWDQGATSFTVVQVSNVLQQRHGARIRVGAVLADPTVAGIARHLRGRSQEERDLALGTIEFFSEDARAAFRASRAHERPRRPDHTPVALGGAPAALADYEARATRRTFGDGPLPLTALEGLLGLLRPRDAGGRTRRLYPSAGDTYAVQAYVHVKAGAVDGLPAGAYYYRPDEHVLEPLDAAPPERSAYFVTDRETFDAAGLALYLVGQTRAVAPLYGDGADRLLDIEAGHIGQLLTTHQRRHGVGLCAIGDVSVDREALGLDDGHRFLLGFLGGPLPRQAKVSGGAAIVGMAGRFPGADDPEALWRNLAAGAAFVGPPAPERASTAGAVGAAGLLERIDEFDSLLFRITPSEARTLDPQQRLLLEAVWACLEDAGHTPGTLRREAPRVGVFIATMWHDYELLQGGASATASDIPQRISNAFGLTGPSLAVDGGCSSSLTALHLAAESLRHGTCDAAIVGAVNLLAHPYHAEQLTLSGLTAERPGGAVGTDADGWAPGEGVAAVLLRPLEASTASGDHVHAVVEATASRHLGATGRFGRLDPAALAASLTETLVEAELTAEDIGYVECAAAGADVVGAAEVEALAIAFAGRERAVPVGTLKPGIGHLEAASGLAGLVKVVLQLRSERLAPTAVADAPNALVAGRGAPLRAVDRLQPWPAQRPRRALINALSAGGAIAHAVVGEAPPRPPAPAAAGPLVVPLSAETPEQLRTCADRLRAHLEEHDVALADVAFTLRSGRARLRHRLEIRCRSPEELRTALGAFVDGRAHPAAHVTEGAPRDGPEWPGPVPDEARRVPLPTYPFARDRHWLAAATRPVPTTDHAKLADLTAHVRRLYAEASGIPCDRLDAQAPLEHYGLTSSLVAELNARLERDFGDVPRTLLYECRTLREVAAALAEHAPTPEPAAVETGDVAIIGIAGRYPGAATVEELAELLEQGRDRISALPSDRRRPEWPVELMWGSFLDDVRGFDPLFFGIAPRDADLMDPQERLFLEVAWETLEDAAYPPRRLRDALAGRVGVFAGTMYSEYPFFGVEQSLRGQAVSTGSSVAGIANRVSYAFDLRGPSLTVDTMCSSSLTAIHLAVTSLQRGECDVALAGGVNLSLHPNKWVEQARLGMSSSDHRCRAFGAGGDGFAPGEGVGAVLLRPLRAAVEAGDRVHAVIRATAVNHDGRTNGYSVPDPVSQGELVAGALRRAGIDPRTIGYVEAHGTGTALGDPIELAGLERAFGKLRSGSCPIGSIKSNIGHLEGAAGIAGLTKVVLQLRRRRLFPTLHAAEPNPDVRWSRTPFRIQATAEDWPEPAERGPRRAGVSAFGAGGSNAHVVVEEHVAPPQPRAVQRPQLVVLSARDGDRLKEVARRLVDRLRHEPPPLDDVAWTLQTGREPLRERVAFVAGDHAELLEKLAAVVAGEDEELLRGSVRGHGERQGAAIGGLDRASLEAVGREWTDGGHVEWGRLHPDGLPRVADLPAYPFLHRPHWVEEDNDGSPPAPAPALPLYSRTWYPAPAAGGARPGALLCLHSAGTAAVARALAATPGTRAILVEDSWADADAAVRLVRSRLLEAGPLDGCIDLCDLGREDDSAGTWPARLKVVQELLRGGASVRILLAVRGLYDLPGPPPSLAGARMAGFLRGLDAEHERLRATVVDVDDIEDAAALLLVEWPAGDAALEVCYRDGVRHRPRLAAVAAPVEPSPLDPDRTYLITGATGAIGGEVARHLVRRGARRLALMGRRSDRAGAVAPLIASLEAAGAQIDLHLGSLTDRAGVGAFVDARKLGGVVHCAGHFGRVGPFAGKDRDEVAAVLEPKVDGLEALLDVCAPQRPDFFVVCTSLAGVAAPLSAGLVDYAAANTFADLLVAYRARAGWPELRSVAWPPWRDLGPDAAAAAESATVDRDEALSILDAVISGPMVPNVVVVPATDGELDPAGLLHRRRPIPSAAVPAVAGEAAAAPAWLAAIFSETLGIPQEDLDEDALFADLGIESVMLAELVEKIEERTGSPTAPSLLLEHPTLAQLAARIGDAASDARWPEPRRARDRVAVIGLACRLPCAPDARSFWENLAAGGCAVGPVPPSRWDADAYFPDRSVSRWGGFVEDIEAFDPEFFGMSDAEATHLDPGIRLVLEVGAACLRDAGYADAELAGRRVGVFLGGRISGYRDRAGVAGDGRGLGGDQNFLAARLAQQLDLNGPSVVVDTACSSALVAVQLAMRSALEDAEMVIAGGVDVLLDERPYLEFTAMGALSPTGRCRTFDERADGFVPGEGCGLVLLKRLDRALAHGDRIHAVIDAVALGNDGRTAGMTTPNPAAQAAVVRQALRDAGRHPGEVGLVEAHGTGTAIGDPIELKALTDVFRDGGAGRGSCAIGSVKSNIGHLFSASGIAGLLKAVLAVEHGEVPPTLFCDTPNSRFDFAASPFFPAMTRSPWPAEGAERVAGVSSFGLGGTNAHAIVSSLPPEQRRPATRRPLPPPEFRRRRLWLEREGELAPVTDGHLVASLLDLEFMSHRNGGSPHRGSE